jgi:lysophospholipase L1-like esterase
MPVLQNNIDLLTISAGGNDIGLTPILSNCIYQFYMSAEDACEIAIREAQARIANETELYHNVTLLIEAAKPKMNKEHGVIYYTGYAGFFGADDSTCDNVTWAVWKDVEWSKQYLKRELRRELNDMVSSVNTILAKAVRDAGPNVRFIDYDKQVQNARGRYCEAGVVEPDPSRRELMFYEWNTVDTGENRTALQNNTGGSVPKGSFEGGIAGEINKTLEEHPDWQFDPDKGFVNKTKGAGSVVGEGWLGDSIHWLLPDSYKRVFHMRPEGHRIVASMLAKDLERWGREKMGGEVEEL